MGNRERRAAKQQRRDQRRGHVAAGVREPAADRGLPPETLRALLRRAGADVAAGDEHAVGELRRVLAEHLARRRAEIVAACDEVLAEAAPATAAAPADGLAGELAERLADGGTVAGWAEGRRAAEDVVAATVELLATRLT